MKMKVIGAALLIVGIVIGRAWAAQETPKKGYVIAQVDVSNPQQYAEYAKQSPGIIDKFGGRFLARAGRYGDARRHSGQEPSRHHRVSELRTGSSMVCLTGVSKGKEDARRRRQRAIHCHRGPVTQHRRRH